MLDLVPQHEAAVIDLHEGVAELFLDAQLSVEVAAHERYFDSLIKQAPKTTARTSLWKATHPARNREQQARYREKNRARLRAAALAAYYAKKAKAA